MSIRESLIKYLTAILRASKETLMVILCDLNGLSIAHIGRKSDLELDPNVITGLASIAFSASEENWNDLGIKEQIIAFSFFEKVCLITIRINQTLLTIVHNYKAQWPLDPDNLASSVYHLKREIGNLFGGFSNSESELEEFSNKVRSAIYLFSMGTEIPFSSYNFENYKELERLKAISNILDSIKNPVLSKYSLVNLSGLTLDARDLSEQSLPIKIEAFSANANVGFQKMLEEAQNITLGSLLSYICISGQDSESFYGILACHSGKLKFSDEITKESNIQNISFVALFPLTYGGIPVIGEARNIIYSILEIIGTDDVTEQFIDSINLIMSSKFQ
jgi:hypothetical protein